MKYTLATNESLTIQRGDGSTVDVSTSFGASGENHAPGLVPDPGSTAGTSKFLREDGTWQEPAGGGVSASVMGGSGENHAAGLVPDQSSTAGTTKFLCEDGTWKEVGTTGLATIRVNLEEYVNGSKSIGTSLIGLEISVQNTTDQTAVVTKTWNGEELVFNNQVPLKNYRITVQNKAGYILDSVYQDITNIGTYADVTKTFKYAYAVTTGYIILDQTSSDPTQKVVDESGHTYATGYATPFVITKIRQLSHCYVGTFANNVMSLKQLDDNDGTKYADGSDASSDITTKNVFMRLPYFYTKTSTYDTDMIKVEFYIDELQTAIPSGNEWKRWGGNDLIGKYEGNCSDTTNNTSGTLRSISGVVSTANVSQTNFKQKARNNGTGFTCVKWKHHNIMAILFYAYYGHTNCQLLIGSGHSSNNKNTGLKNANGMSDTTSTTGNTNNIVFWGLENWWGNKCEYFDNVTVNFPNYAIREDNNSTRTITTTSTSTASWIYPTKFILGDNLDILAAPGSTGGTNSTGYCDGQYFKTDADLVAYRSSADASPIGGVAMVAAADTSSYTLSNRGSRLAFTGTVEITN